MRKYRLSTLAGQTSDVSLAAFAVLIIDELYEKLQRPITVLDVGCGSGQVMQCIEHQVQDRLGKHLGVDCSVSGLKTAQEMANYDYVLPGDINNLPFLDKEFDLVIVFEIIEHLYKNQVIPCLKEWQRVSNYMVLSTPFAQDVINISFLKKEVNESSMDQDALYRQDYLALAGAVHKSALFHEGMTASGFKQVSKKVNVWHAATNSLEFDRIQHVGIDPQDLPPEDQDHRAVYHQLLLDSWHLLDEITSKLPQINVSSHYLR